MDDLTDDDLAALEDALHALEASLATDLAALAARAQTVALDQAAVGRVSRGDAMQQQQMALAERRRLELRQKQVERALKAVDAGEYGDCARCGEPIAPRRLHARPETPFCVACATTLGA